jgi:hypothetical protein
MSAGSAASGAGPDLNSIREMEDFLAARNVSSADCLDKESLRERVRETAATWTTASPGSAASSATGSAGSAASGSAGSAATTEKKFRGPPSLDEKVSFEPLTPAQLMKRYPLPWAAAMKGSPEQTANVTALLQSGSDLL